MNATTKKMLKDLQNENELFFAEMDAKIAAAQKMVTDAEIMAAKPLEMDTVAELLAALENIEDRADEEMGEWASVAYGQLPIKLNGLWYIREYARDAIARAERE